MRVSLLLALAMTIAQPAVADMWSERPVARFKVDGDTFEAQVFGASGFIQISRIPPEASKGDIGPEVARKVGQNYLKRFGEATCTITGAEPSSVATPDLYNALFMC